MFIVALFTIAKIWKQPKSPSRDDWIKKMEQYSAMKKEWNFVICSNTDGLGGC